VSSRWTAGEKLLGTLVVPGGPGLLLLLSGMQGQSCTSGSLVQESSGVAPIVTEETCSGFALPVWIGVPLLALLLVAPFVVGAVLLRRARARA
jgi:hypothetical protein